MSNKKLKKEDEKMLKAYANSLKPIWQTAKQREFVMGFALLREGKTEVDGKKIKATAKYERIKNVHVSVNHYRRLRDSWLKDGQNGIENYLFFYRGIIEQTAKHENLQHAQN